MRFFKNYGSKYDDNEGGGEEESSSRGKLMSKRVYELIHNEKWDKVPKILRGKYGSGICDEADESGLSILGIAVGSNPPLHIIELILKIKPSLSTKPDGYGALPIHLACLNGASAVVIKALIKHDRGATVKIPDEDQRVPLHHAVEFSARLDIQENASPQEFNSNFSDSRSSLSSYSNFEEDLDIISSLCNTAPELVRHTDKNGDTPIDVANVIRGIARTEKQHFRIEKVYHILRNASIAVYKREKKAWELRGYFIPEPSKPLQDPSESETVTSWSMGSQSSFSKSVGSKSDQRFACSDQELDLTKDLEDDQSISSDRGDTRYVNRSKMKFFGFS